MKCKTFFELLLSVFILEFLAKEKKITTVVRQVNPNRFEFVQAIAAKFDWKILVKFLREGIAFLY